MLAEPAPSTTPTPAAPCLDDTVCNYIFDRTGNEWLAAGGYYLLVKPARIVLIILIAIVIRHIAIKMVDRVASSASEGKGSGLLRPLRERIPMPAREATGLRLERRRQRSEALASVLNSVASVSIFAVAAMMVLAELGVNLAPLIASAGIVGVAFGFGAQNLVRDFIAGLFMLLEDQYGVGDTIDVGDVSGTVESVGLRITTVRDESGVLWYVRNGEITRIGNLSQGWSRVIIDLSVAVDSDIEEVEKAMLDTAKGLAKDPKWRTRILEQPEVWGLESISGDALVIRLVMKTRANAKDDVARELRMRLKHAVDEMGITLPALNTIMPTGIEGALRVRGANPPKTKPNPVAPAAVERPVWRPKRTSKKSQPQPGGDAAPGTPPEGTP